MRAIVLAIEGQGLKSFGACDTYQSSKHSLGVFDKFVCRRDVTHAPEHPPGHLRAIDIHS